MSGETSGDPPTAAVAGNDPLLASLSRYLLEAAQEWAADYEVTLPEPVPAALLFLTASLHGYAENPTRENLAELLASAGGLCGTLADKYQFPG